MCHALLRIKYKGEKGKTAEIVEVDSEASLVGKIKELQGRDQVLTIGVFRRSHDVSRYEEWRQTVYAPKADDDTPELKVVA